MGLSDQEVIELVIIYGEYEKLESEAMMKGSSSKTSKF